jgi:hypothetical protein
MAEVINNNVIEAGKKFVDFSGLDYFWTKAKNYIDGVDAAMSAKVVTLENTVGDSTKGLVKGLADLKNTVDALGNIEGGEGIGGMIDTKIAALDLPNTYEAKGAAAQALEDAQAYADGLVMVDGAAKFDVAGAAAKALEDAQAYADGLVMNGENPRFDAAGTAAGFDAAMNTRVAKLEAIDHDKIAADAAAAAVAGVIDDAPESFDTLKEVAAWIANNDHATDVATLMTDVANLKQIDHDAYKAADTALETSLQGYVDGKVDGKFDAAGAAATAKAEAIADAEAKYQVKGNYEAAGAADAALAAAKADAEAKYQVKGNYEAAGTADTKIAALDLPNSYDAKGAAAAAQAAAIAQAKLDAADALKAYYTKTEIDNLLSTNSAADQAYAKTYTDQLFNSIQFAANSDIDAIFAEKAE